MTDSRTPQPVVRPILEYVPNQAQRRVPSGGSEPQKPSPQAARRRSGQAPQSQDHGGLSTVTTLHGRHPDHFAKVDRKRKNRGTASSGHLSSMERAISELKAHDIAFTQPTEYQLKIQKINYYPAKGTLHIDGAVSPIKKQSLEETLAFIARHAS